MKLRTSSRAAHGIKRRSRLDTQLQCAQIAGKLGAALRRFGQVVMAAAAGSAAMWAAFWTYFQWK